MDEPSPKDDDEDSLEVKQETTESSTINPSADNNGQSSSDSPEPTSAPAPTTAGAPKADLQKDSKAKKGFVKKLFKKFDIYLMAVVLIIIIAAVAIFIVTSNNQKDQSANSQSLSQATIDQLNNNDVNVGGAQQTLNIESNSVFAGNVLVKSNLQVAGTLKLGGSLNLPGISVSGTTALDSVSASNLSVSGAVSIQGQLTVKQALTDDGPASFAGNISAPEITVSTLQLNGDIQIAHHITTNGSIPSDHTAGALGGGGTTTVSGTDTAGTVDVNIGSNPSDGCFATIGFTSNFTSAPHVVITPVQTGSSTPPNVSFYVTRTTSSFSICGAISSYGGTSFGFDYIVVD